MRNKEAIVAYFQISSTGIR